jgi:hypothetical protein
MHVARIDVVIRSLAARAPRRGVLAVLAGVVLGLTAAGPAPNTDAKRRRKKKRRKKQPPLQFNAFGCLDVGQKCRGRDELCCSGICDGKKPQKGEPDKTRCLAHNTGGCAPQQDLCTTDPNTRCGASGICARTTGNAGFCLLSPPDGLNCSACKNDADCVVGFGPGAACTVCDVACPGTRTICAPPAA